MKLPLTKLFGEYISIDSETFEKEVNSILGNPVGISKVSLEEIKSRMTTYRQMLEGKLLDTVLLETILKEIIVISLAFVHHSEPYSYLRDTLIRKNADYGNSSIRNGGNVGNYVRLSDKVSRIENLASKIDCNYESLEDTWLDLAGYATIGIIITRLTVLASKQEHLDFDSPFGYNPEVDG